MEEEAALLIEERKRDGESKSYAGSVFASLA